MNEHFASNKSIPAIVLLLLLLAFTLSAQSGNAAQTFTGEVMDSICAESGSHAAVMAKTPNMGTDSESCTKKCIAMGAKYMLYDQASHSAYSVDNEDKLAQFAGHKVRVTGTLVGSKIKVEDVSKLG